jgi:tetratricopeptide (TPR) repeat protein
VYVAAAQELLGRCHFLQGELSQAWEHLSSLAASDLQSWSGPEQASIPILAMRAEINASFLLLAMGYMDQARQRLEQGLATWGGSMSPLDTSHAQSLIALFYATCHQDDLAREWATKALCAVEGRDAPEVWAWSAEILGWVEARAGQPQSGIARITAALASERLRGTETTRFAHEAFLAEAYLADSDNTRALEVLDEALEQVDKTGTRIYEAELWRLRGETLLLGEWAGSKEAFDEAEFCFRRAIEIAQRQGARFWELRATVSLTCLYRQQGRGEEARQALTTIYATFSEGLDWPDLVQARALLDGADDSLPDAEQCA